MAGKKQQVVPIWREASRLYRDQETDLPLALGGFTIHKTRANGHWQLTHPDGTIVDLPAANVFNAYRSMLDAFEGWTVARPVKRVYFIGEAAEHLAKIKIGVSRDPATRLRTLQTGYPAPLRLLATTDGDEGLEAEYHRRFHHQRRQGEWFVANAAIIAEIARLSSEGRGA